MSTDSDGIKKARPRPYLTHEDDKDDACRECGCPFPEDATCWNTHLDTLKKLREAEHALASAQAETAVLVNAIEQYGCHRIGCSIHRRLSDGCNCGFKTVLVNFPPRAQAVGKVVEAAEQQSGFHNKALSQVGIIGCDCNLCKSLSALHQEERSQPEPDLKRQKEKG